MVQVDWSVWIDAAWCGPVDFDVRFFAEEQHFDAMAVVLGFRLCQPAYSGSYDAG